MADFRIRLLLNIMFRVFTAFITCTVGALIGIITGAIKGQTMETGIVRGAGVGAVSGAIVALQVVDMVANGQPFSKVALLRSLLHGKLFIEWLVRLKDVIKTQKTSAMETSFIDMFNMENNVPRGLSEDVIQDIPKRIFEGLPKTTQRDDTCNDTNCVICLQDFENREEGRELPSCRHVFHVHCIDEWLIR
ncbi:hypothetical protein M8C21_020463, partial [Ambrosia artemisiifolia]